MSEPVVSKYDTKENLFLKFWIPSLGEAPSRWAIFCNFFGKKSYFNAMWSHFAGVQSHLKALDFRHLKANRKNQNVYSSFYLQFKSKTRLTSCILELNFNCKWFAPGRGK